MEKSKFLEHQIINILKKNKSGKSTRTICHEHGITTSTIYYWKQKHGDINAQHWKELKALQEENSRFKQVFTVLRLEHRILKDIIENRL